MNQKNEEKMQKKIYLENYIVKFHVSPYAWHDDDDDEKKLSQRQTYYYYHYLETLTNEPKKWNEMKKSNDEWEMKSKWKNRSKM